jgi:hypothetical protein
MARKHFTNEQIIIKLLHADGGQSVNRALAAGVPRISSAQLIRLPATRTGSDHPIAARFRSTSGNGSRTKIKIRSGTTTGGRIRVTDEATVMLGPSLTRRNVFLVHGGAISPTEKPWRSGAVVPMGRSLTRRLNSKCRYLSLRLDARRRNIVVPIQGGSLSLPTARQSMLPAPRPIWRPPSMRRLGKRRLAFRLGSSPTTSRRWCCLTQVRVRSLRSAPSSSTIH